MKMTSSGSMSGKYHQRCAGEWWKMVAAAMFSSPSMGAYNASPVGISGTSTFVLCVPSWSPTERPSHSATGMSCGGADSTRHRLKAMKRR